MSKEAIPGSAADWSKGDWQDARARMSKIVEVHYGPIVGYFTMDGAATNGSHPEEVREAWAGIPLPVRESHLPVEDEAIYVACTDGFNALVEAGVKESVLNYWINVLGGAIDLTATFVFNHSDGIFSPATKTPLSRATADNVERGATKGVGSLLIGKVAMEASPARPAPLRNRVTSARAQEALERQKSNIAELKTGSRLSAEDEQAIDEASARHPSSYRR